MIANPNTADRVWTPPGRTPGFAARLRREVYRLATLDEADLAQCVLAHPRPIAAAARHEAGHVVVGLALGIKVAGVQIASDGSGSTFFERPSLSRIGTVEATAFALAGAMAEGGDSAPSLLDRGIVDRARLHALRENKALPIEHDREARQLARRVLTLSRPAVGLVAALLAKYRTLTEHEVGEALVIQRAVRRPEESPTAQRAEPRAARGVRRVRLPTLYQLPYSECHILV